MLKKNLSKRVTSAVLAIFFLCVSVAPVCSASNPPKKRPKLKRQSSWMNQRPKKGNSRFVDLIEYDYDEDDCYPEEDYEDKKYKESVMSSFGNSVGNTTGILSNNDETEGNNFNVNDAYDWEEEEEEWNEPTKKEDEKVGNSSLIAEEEKNNLNDNDDHIANAEESGTQNGNTATNDDGQNNPEPFQDASHRGYQESWNEIVFSDDNNE